MILNKFKDVLNADFDIFVHSMKGASFTTALTTAVGLTLTLLLLGTLLVIAFLGKQWESSLRSAARVQVYFMRDVDAGTLHYAQEALRTDAAVSVARFLDAETASRQLEAELGESFVDFLGYVPLPEAMDLTLNAAHSNLDSLQVLAQMWSDLPGVAEVVWPETLLQSLDDGIRRVTAPLLMVAGLFLIISVLLMNNTIRLSIFSKRFIIKTMQLVGAKPRSIRAPFLWSGVALGLISGLLAFAIITGLLSGFKSMAGDLGVAVNLPVILGLGGLLISMGVVVAWGATWFSVNRFLRADDNSLH